MKTITNTQRRISVARKLVLLLFLISGSAGLIYEVTWTRAFGVVFGNTVFAVSTVLTAFMLGLALGSWLFGRVADRGYQPLKLFALLEVGVGAYAFGFPSILAATDIFYRWFFRSFHPSFYPLSLIRFALSIVILLIPTVLMGGTLPVLSRLWVDPSIKKARGARIGQSVGLLYAVNTFGAVAGSFLAGYFLMRILGVSNTIYLAASANILVGILSFLLSSFIRQPHGKVHKQSVLGLKLTEKILTESEAVEQPGKKRLIVLVAVALAGFCALALEVLWARVLVFVLGTSAYAFACMLTCFIFGLALGSFVCSRLPLGKIRNPIFVLGVVEFLVALSVLWSIHLSGTLWYIDYMLIMKMKLRMVSFWKEVITHFIDTSIVLLLPTVLMGFVFPIAVETCTRSWKTVGKRVGEVYASNTVGCVIGSFAAGFVMVPLLGLRDSFVLVVAIQLLLAAAVILFSERKRLTTAVAVVLLLVIIANVLRIPQLKDGDALYKKVTVSVASAFYIPRDVFLRTMNTYHYPSRIVYIKDDATGTVTVHDVPDGDRLIAVDGVDVAGIDLMLRTTQKLQGYVPLLVHEDPKEVLQIGFGSGETSGVGLGIGVENYNVVEICPGVFEAGKFFENINRASYKNPRLRKIIMDGKNFVKLTDEKFDVIMNDSTYPGTTGSSALYTYEHFEQCREHLKPGGVLSCWIPLDLRPVDLQLIFRTFQKVMPHCSLWMANNCLNKHAVLVGTLSPMQIDFQRIKRLIERPDISSDLAIIKIYSVYDLLDCFMVDEGGLRLIGGDGPLNTDDKPYLEFGAVIKRDLDECLMVALNWLSSEHSAVLPYLINLGDTEEELQQVRATLHRFFTGTGYALQGLIGILQGDPQIMEIQFEMARKVNPLDGDIKSCLDELDTEIRALVAAVERTPTDASLRSRLAKRYFLLRDYERAAEEYRNFVALEPENAAAWSNLGLCYEGLERFKEAVSAFEKAIGYDAGLLAAYQNRGRVYEKLGDFAAASRSFEEAALISPPSQRVYIYDMLARLYFMQKKYGPALETLEKALELVPSDSEMKDYLQNRRELVKRAAEGTELNPEGTPP